MLSGPIPARGQPVSAPMESHTLDRVPAFAQYVDMNPRIDPRLGAHTHMATNAACDRSRHSVSARDLRGYGGRRRLAASLGVKPPRRGV